MNGALLLWPLLAVLVFWAVGMRNRVLSLRMRALDSFGELERQIMGYAALIRSLATVPAGMPPWEAMQQHTQLLEAACKSVRASMLTKQTMDKLGALLQVLAQQWLAVLQAPADLAGSPVPETVQQLWEDIDRRVQMATAAFNHLAGQYNEALNQRPARWVVHLMGLRSAGLL